MLKDRGLTQIQVAKHIKPQDVKKVEQRADTKNFKIEINVNKMYHKMFERYLPGYLPKDVYEKLYPPQPAPVMPKNNERANQ